MHQPTIAVIGAGFSGTVLSLRLRAVAPAGTRIVLLERSGRFGPGLAYGAAGPTHLLNAPASRMSALATLPNDFFHWLRRRPSHPPGAGVGEDSFVPRQLYGAYLAELLELNRRDARATTLELVHDEVRALSTDADHLTLHCAGGRCTASIAVLAVGHAEPPVPHQAVPKLAAAGLWHNDPWLPAAMADLEPGAPVLLVGTGLTMVDAALSLLDSGRPGPIHALSRHGMLPRAHLASPVSPTILPDQLPAEPRGLLRLLRREANTAAVAANHRRAATAHGRTVAKHERARPPALPAALVDLLGHPSPSHAGLGGGPHRSSASHRPAAGPRGTYCRSHPQRAGRGRYLVSPREQQPGGAVRRACDQLLRSGAGDAQDHRLLRSLLWDGLIRPDPLDIGLDVTPDGAVLDRAGMASDRLFAIGPLTRSTVWDGTSVPELRLHCERMARTLSQALSRPVASFGGAPGARTNPAWLGVMSPS